jgi:hypothetical protein
LKKYGKLLFSGVSAIGGEADRSGAIAPGNRPI